MGYSPLLSLLILMLKFFQVWLVGLPSREVMCSFKIPPQFFLSFPHFLAHRHSRLFLYFLYPSPRISHFSQEPWFLLMESYMKKQVFDPSVFTVTGVSLFLGSLSSGQC